MKTIAIVTPELAGLYKNGGIGTNYFYRARFLRGALNYAVTILYTGACSPNQAAAWREQFGPMGIQLELLPALPAGKNWEAVHARAMAVHQWLAARAWDEIHLPEYLANGFVCVQAKRAGLAYQNTRLVVTMHSSSLWLREGMQTWPVEPETDAKLDFAERYCCENADTLISPSQFLMDWAQRKGWRLPANHVVLPSLYERPNDSNSPAPPFNPRHLIFFGRLQSSKGLGIFCEAVSRLVRAGHAPARVDFLGAVTTFEGRPSDQFIRLVSSQWRGTEVRIHTDLDSFAAVDHLRRSGGLAVIASRCDNLPYAVIECIMHQVPFIASHVGGIPELADARVLFAPDARALAAKLEAIFQRPIATEYNHPYQLETVQAAWRKFAATPEIFAPATPRKAMAKISVCVPFYNHAKYLPATLAALARQTHENFEVIVVDDGSTDAAARDAFAAAEKNHAAPRFRFFRTANAGIGGARNFAVTQATGEWLVFVDADNVACETMLAVFARALQFSGADCATCHYNVFYEDAERAHPPKHTVAPLGPCLEIGWRVNVFGDANFIVKKAVFEKLGGFATSRIIVEDWVFLVRLALQGFSQIVVPESLYWYRWLPNSQMRQADDLQVARAILETYREGLAAWPAAVIENYAFGPFVAGITGGTIVTQTRATFTSCQPAAARRRLPRPLRKFQKSCVKRLLEFAEFLSRL